MITLIWTGGASTSPPRAVAPVCRPVAQSESAWFVMTISMLSLKVALKGKKRQRKT